MRTFITAFAGSIGIIGVALILALSSGFNSYIAKMQTDTLSSFPLTISSSALDMSSFMSMMQMPDAEKYPEVNEIYINTIYIILRSAAIIAYLSLIMVTPVSPSPYLPERKLSTFL